MDRMPLSFQLWGRTVRSCIFVGLILVVSACGTPADKGGKEPTEVELTISSTDYLHDDGTCDVSELQDLVGETATDELGERIQRESGARTLRWGPPNTAWTMDYREDRVNVRYDEDMIITDIACG